jgi:hypothetical protein
MLAPAVTGSSRKFLHVRSILERCVASAQTLTPSKRPCLPAWCACCCIPRLLRVSACTCYMRPHAPASSCYTRLLLHVYACHVAAHACKDRLYLCSLPVLANKNTCNMKHLLEHTSETDETFWNIRLQHMQHPDKTLTTYIYSHYNICNFQINNYNLQHENICCNIILQHLKNTLTTYL